MQKKKIVKISTHTQNYQHKLKQKKKNMGSQKALLLIMVDWLILNQQPSSR